MATCPECDADLDIEDDDLEEMEVGDPWDCEACGSRLRVAGLDPLEFDSDEDDESEDEDEEGKAVGEEESDEVDDDFEDDDDDADDDEGGGGDWEE
jgi:alpha-aminoadipate carrier protein LysW